MCKNCGDNCACKLQQTAVDVKELSKITLGNLLFQFRKFGTRQFKLVKPDEGRKIYTFYINSGNNIRYVEASRLKSAIDCLMTVHNFSSYDGFTVFDDDGNELKYTIVLDSATYEKVARQYDLITAEKEVDNG